jgi:bifunctional DNase/RNase
MPALTQSRTHTKHVRMDLSYDREYFEDKKTWLKVLQLLSDCSRSVILMSRLSVEEGDMSLHVVSRPDHALFLAITSRIHARVYF